MASSFCSKIKVWELWGVKNSLKYFSDKIWWQLFPLLYLELLKPWAAYFDTASPKIRGNASAYISSGKWFLELHSCAFMHTSRTLFCLKHPWAQWWDPRQRVANSSTYPAALKTLMMENQVHCWILSLYSGLSGRHVVLFFPFCLWCEPWIRVEKMPCPLLCLCNLPPLQMGLCRKQPCSVNCQRRPVLRRERQDLHPLKLLHP